MGSKKIIDVDDLVGSAEIAQRLGARRQQVVHDWRRRHPEFPEPVARLSVGFLWDWSEVEAWAKLTGRVQGEEAGRD